MQWFDRMHVLYPKLTAGWMHCLVANTFAHLTWLWILANALDADAQKISFCHPNRVAEVESVIWLDLCTRHFLEVGGFLHGLHWKSLLLNSDIIVIASDFDTRQQRSEAMS